MRRIPFVCLAALALASASCGDLLRSPEKVMQPRSIAWMDKLTESPKPDPDAEPEENPMRRILEAHIRQAQSGAGAGPLPDALGTGAPPMCTPPNMEEIELRIAEAREMALAEVPLERRDDVEAVMRESAAAFERLLATGAAGGGIDRGELAEEVARSYRELLRAYGGEGELPPMDPRMLEALELEWPELADLLRDPADDAGDDPGGDADAEPQKKPKMRSWADLKKERDRSK